MCELALEPGEKSMTFSFYNKKSIDRWGLIFLKYWLIN